MRLATWNVNSVVVRLPRLVDWLATTAPDILCIQETKIADELFPRAGVEALGYEVALHGEGRWNGVAIISRVGLARSPAGVDGDVWLDQGPLGIGDVAGIMVDSHTPFYAPRPLWDSL